MVTKLKQDQIKLESLNLTGIPTAPTAPTGTKNNQIANTEFVGKAIEAVGFTVLIPTASSTTLGGIKVGNNLTITDGVLSANAQPYSLPTASASIKGGIKIGAGLTMTNEVLSVDTAISADTFLIENTAFIRYNSTTECIEFVFN